MRLVAIPILLLSVTVLSATPPQRTRVVQTNQQFLATQFQPLQQIQLPSYGAGYNGGISDETGQRLAAAIEKLVAQLEKVNGPQGPPPNPKLPQGDDFSAKATAIFTERCSSCHAKGVAQKNGKGVVLMDGGKIVPLSADLERDLIHDLWREKMPKQGKKLNDTELSEVMEYLYQAKRFSNRPAE